MDKLSAFRVYAKFEADEDQQKEEGAKRRFDVMNKYYTLDTNTLKRLSTIFNNSYRMQNILRTIYTTTDSVEKTRNICLDILEREMPKLERELTEKRVTAANKLRQKVDERRKHNMTQKGKNNGSPKGKNNGTPPGIRI